MFDDHPSNNLPASGVPNNLPIGEPEDMFAGVDDDVSLAPPPMGKPVEPTEPTAQASSPSALSAGVLRPRQPVVEPVASNRPSSLPPSPKPNPVIPSEKEPAFANYSPPDAPEVYQIRDPSMSRIIMRLVVTAVVLVIIGGGGWLIYNSFIKEPAVNLIVPVDNAMLDLTTVDNEAMNVNEVAAPAVDETDYNILPTENLNPELDNTASEIIDERILFGEPIDRDGDGLDDYREQEIGTDPNNWDSDGDELSDGDEVVIWKTDPFNPDSDGDTFLDGIEVKNGYNPAGPGKFMELPAEEEVAL